MIFNGTIEQAMTQATQINPKWKRHFNSGGPNTAALKKRNYTN
jgi:hypothetical protein